MSQVSGTENEIVVHAVNDEQPIEKKKPSEIWEWTKSIGTALVIVLIIHFFIFNFLKGQYFCSTSHAILYVQYIHRHTCTCMQSLAQLNLDLRIHPSPHCIMYIHLFYFTSFSTYGTGIACEWSERFRPSEWHLASTDSKHEKYPFEQEPHLNAGGTGLSPSPREAFHRCLPERCTYST